VSLFILSNFDGLYLVEGGFQEDENSFKRQGLIVSTEEKLPGTICLNHNEEKKRFLAGKGKQASGVS